MSFDIDPRFKASSTRARKRVQQRRVQRIGLAATCCIGLIAIFFVGKWALSGGETPQEVAATPEIESSEEAFAMVEDGRVDIIAARAPFIDLAKDPLILNLEQEIDGAGLYLQGPPQLDRDRVGPSGPEQLTLVRDELVVQTTRLVTTIPSSRADLAYFQAARGQALELLEEPQHSHDEAETTAGDIVTIDGDEGSWGELIETQDQDGAVDEATYVITQIENTTSVASALRTTDRLALFQDDIIVVQTPRPLGDILQTAGLAEAQADLIVRGAGRQLDLSGDLAVGSVVALRIKPTQFGNTLMQMSLYSADSYIGTLVQIGPGRFDTGADPWLGEDLLARTQDARAVAVRQQEIRLLDAIYSASIRNGMPTPLVGELIVMMSQHADLDRFAAEGDDISILFATTPGAGGQGAAQLLYAGIRGPSGTVDCYVVRNPEQDTFECHRQQMMQSSNGGVGAGLIVPVNGTKTSDFGPRMHPVLRQMRNHNGVDWGAPTGTPIHAAADGTIALAGNGGGYGNVVYIDHSEGRQTRYAHMNAFADGIRTGSVVKAGDVIGYVGTTGRSTGPHLHFELRVHGNPVDPLSYEGTSTVAVSNGGTPGGAAVEALVNQIIRVESAGNANAANPLSSARGLGQFIESTWLRMMEAYRPDLVRSMSRADLLNLRFNPELSREMVRNLARESEAYLRARGHSITAGRLYLAHFLGAEGAHVALSANPDLLVSQVMGNGVVNANPFLRGDTIRELWSWADRKMGSAPAAPSTPQAPRAAPVSAEVAAYIEVIDGILEEL